MKEDLQGIRLSEAMKDEKKKGRSVNVFFYPSSFIPLFKG
jgi:hypothetical protein